MVFNIKFMDTFLCSMCCRWLMQALIGRARYCVTCKFSLILIFSQSFASWIVFLASNDEMRHRERGDVYCIDLVHTSPADFWFASIRTQNLINYYAKEHTWYKSVPITVPIESWHLLSRRNMAILSNRSALYETGKFQGCQGTTMPMLLNGLADLGIL